MAKKQIAISLRKPPSPESLDAFVSAGADQPPDEVHPSLKRSRSRAAQPKQAEPTAAEQTTAVMAEPPAPRPEPPSATTIPLQSMVQAVKATERESAPTEPITGNATVEVTLTPSMVSSNGVPLRPVTVYLPQAMAERLARHCIEQDRDASNVIGEVLEQHLSKRLGPGAAPLPPARPEAEREGTRYSTSAFWREVPFGQPDGWPGRRIERLFEMGRLLIGLVRRRGYVG
jgi:hypothetical protein